MTTATDIANFADELLHTSSVSDYPNALNGLQVATDEPIRGLAAAVDFSGRSVAGAHEAGANFLIVHHGAFWAGAQPLVGARHRVFSDLMKNSIGVYSSHLPLDCHPELGNNVLLAKELGLRPNSGFAKFKDMEIGVSGETDLPAEEIISRARAFAESHDGRIHHTPYPAGKKIKRWALCTGGGATAETLHEAAARDVDVLIVGEGPHWTAVEAEETGMLLVYAGHYATETLGVQALARTLAARFQLPWHFIPTPTGT